MQERESEFHLGAMHQEFFGKSKSKISTGWLKLPQSRSVHFKDAIRQSVMHLPADNEGTSSYSYGVG